jgi:hypothetical protein
MGNNRTVKNWTDERVDDCVVAPHRYTFDSTSSYRDATDFREFLAGVPYKEGDVVYIERVEGGQKVAKRAKIYSVWFERDRFGDRRERFHVQFETKKGTWSKVWERTWCGYIQRGYQLAGLAPDLDAADAMARAHKAKLRRANMKVAG